LADPRREELKVEQRRAVLVAVIPHSSPVSRDNALEELRGLVKTAGVHVVGELVQVRDKPHVAHCLGTGKLEELQQLITATDAELVVFDNNLTPAQGKRLETELNTVIVDRSEVILDIFATHARTYEAMLQVELAQLLYFRTRLKRMWTHLERIQGGIGTGRGPGEKQLETDRRLIDRRVAELKRKLADVEKRRERTVSQRRERTTVSLVGYTNAGKSTLMRRLTGADVLVADQLFATLDTRTRLWRIPHWGEVLLSDTVGFVRNLPHHLVASFRSTLEEARHADLLLHVVDASHPEALLQVQTVFEVLEEIGVNCENVLLVLNKVDRITDRTQIDILRSRFPDTVSISAATGEGMQQLEEETARRLGDGYAEVTVQADIGNGKVQAFLAQHADSLSTRYSDHYVTVECRIPRQFLRELQSTPGVTCDVHHAQPGSLPVEELPKVPLADS
jgi:GTP-binding protein HflX